MKTKVLMVLMIGSKETQDTNSMLLQRCSNFTLRVWYQSRMPSGLRRNNLPSLAAKVRQMVKQPRLSSNETSTICQKEFMFLVISLFSSITKHQGVPVFYNDTKKYRYSSIFAPLDICTFALSHFKLSIPLLEIRSPIPR